MDTGYDNNYFRILTFCVVSTNYNNDMRTLNNIQIG